MVGPDYVKPSAPVSPSWLSQAKPSEQFLEHSDWWKSFSDETLNSLIETAYKQNLSLQLAGAKVLEARAKRAFVVGELYPQTQVIGAESKATHVSQNAVGPTELNYATYSLGANASWELDFWGRYRRGIESADAALLSSVADYDTVLLSLLSEVANAYILIRELEARLEVARASVVTQQDTLRLTQIRFKEGAVSELDVSEAQGTLAKTQASIPTLENYLRQEKNTLCFLLGMPPSELTEELKGNGGIPTPPVEIALGIPADLLRRRPDVRSAELLAQAQNAQIGVAKADLYPSFTLSGMTGFETSDISSFPNKPNLKNLFDSKSFTGFIGLGINWPFLNYGRIENNVRIQDALFEQAVISYRNTVLNAASEVENGISGFLKSRESTAFLEVSVAAAKKSLDLSLVQYRDGAIDFIRVNDAQTFYLTQQDQLLSSKSSTARAAVSTFKALGGGWQIRNDNEFVSKAVLDEMTNRTDWDGLISPNYSKGSDLGFSRP